jgi:hypothetical protein
MWTHPKKTNGFGFAFLPNNPCKAIKAISPDRFD